MSTTARNLLVLLITLILLAMASPMALGQLPLLREHAGSAQHDWTGYSVAGLGDLDADGHADYAVSSIGSDVFGADLGIVSVHSGASGTPLLLFTDMAGAGLFGRRIADVGDIDGNGTRDLAVRYGGDLHIRSMPDGGLLTVIPASVSAAPIVAFDGAGDFDGDGILDVVIGCPDDDTAGPSTGSVHVCSGLNGTVIASRYGANAGDRLGFSVAGAGLVNADGLADIVVGAPLADLAGVTSGLVEILAGPNAALIHAVPGAQTSNSMGASVAGIGDVNGDGRADVLAGGPYGTGFSAPGRIFIISGLTGTVIHETIGQTHERYGTTAAGVGDVNADGVPDYAVGAPGSNESYAYVPARTYIYSGVDHALLLLDQDVNPCDDIGHPIDAAGDVNGDGIDDLIVGYWRAGPPLQQNGIARILSIGGARRYGLSTPFLPGVELGWQAGPLAHGAVTVTGATPGEVAVMLLGVVPAWAPVGPLMLHVAWTAPGSSVFLLPLDETGGVSLVMSLHQPGLAGLNAFAQVIVGSGGGQASNGLELRFLP